MYIIIVLQEDITNFRPKLAAILWDSRFNTRKVFEDSEEIEETMGTPSDVEVIDPCEVIDPSDVELIQSLPGVTEDIRSDGYLCTGISSMNKQELLHAVLMYIKSVDDAESLQ